MGFNNDTPKEVSDARVITVVRSAKAKLSFRPEHASKDDHGRRSGRWSLRANRATPAAGHCWSKPADQQIAPLTWPWAQAARGRSALAAAASVRGMDTGSSRHRPGGGRGGWIQPPPAKGWARVAPATMLTVAAAVVDAA
jgi:hypothetical protein